MAITGVQGSNSPNVIIQQGTSVNSFLSVNTSWVFGVVKVIYPGCQKFQVGDSVFYDKSQARWFKSGSINYYAIDEKYIFFIETPAVIIP